MNLPDLEPELDPDPDPELERLRGWLRDQLQLLRSEGIEWLSASGAASVHAAVFEASGKLLRPRLTLLAAACGESDWTLARRAALAIELLHVGTLYHDDVVDRSPRRRGRAAVHERWGASIATFAGAHLMCRGNALAGALPDPLPRIWGVALGKVADGQLRELEHAGSLEVEPRDYLRMAALKTATLFELGARLGGELGGLTPDRVDALRCFGSHLGLAFQLVDDLEDFVSREHAHREGPTDLRERIYTLPVLLGCAGETESAARLRRLLRDDGRPLSAEAIAESCRLLARSGAFEAAARPALEELDEAAASLSALEEGAPRESLRGFVEELRGRVPECLGALSELA